MNDQEKLRKLKTRWFRWLGQKTRRDKSYWVTLLDSNWSSWPAKVFERVGLDWPTITIHSNRSDVHYIFECAIAEANMQDLIKLDNLYATELVEKLR